MPEYIVSLRHTDKTRTPAVATFVAWGGHEGRAIIAATDQYRERFGQPERGIEPLSGLRWVNCDFMIESSARYIPLRVTA